MTNPTITDADAGAIVTKRDLQACEAMLIDLCAPMTDAVAVEGAVHFARHREEATAELRAERDTLRKIAIDAGKEAGAILSDEVSTEFLEYVPNEVNLRLAKAQAEIARLREALWRCKRLGERHAEIMLNPERTGHWKGADRTAQAFLGIAKDAGKALTKAGEA